MAEPVKIPFDLNHDNYGDFICRLRSTLAEHPGKMDVCNKDVLAKQTGRAKQPARWIHIRLVGNNNEETTVAIRDDNVYLFGFRNQDGQWYEFGYSGKSIGMLNEQQSTFLECDIDYGCIVGGAMNLVNLPLGQRFACGAISRLSRYNQDPVGVAIDEIIRKDLACLIVMICEATRLNDIYSTVKDGWYRQHGRKINTKLVWYIWNWGLMSRELLRWNQLPPATQDNFNFPKKLVRIGVKGPGKALEIVKMLLNWLINRLARGEREPQQHAAGDDRGQTEQQPPSKRSRTHQQLDRGQTEQQQQQPNQGRCHSHSNQQETREADDFEYNGRPLVEVFAVRAGFHFVGRIAVFDGMRGQIIFKNEDPIDDSAPLAEGENNLLLLTGPYAAISAMGSFAIEVEIPDPQRQGECATDVGELNWDSYNNENEYDKPITETITTNSSGKKVEVIYAVLSDAVEVKVDLNLRLPGATAQTRIYGQIAVRSEAFSGSDEAWSMLFDSKVKGEALTDDGPASMAPLLLARSIIAMPLGRPLVIKATLYDAPPRPGVNHIFECQALGLTLSEPMTVLHIENGGEVQVMISTHDRVPTDDATETYSSSCSQWACPNRSI